MPPWIPHCLGRRFQCPPKPPPELCLFERTHNQHASDANAPPRHTTNSLRFTNGMQAITSPNAISSVVGASYSRHVRLSREMPTALPSHWCCNGTRGWRRAKAGGTRRRFIASHHLHTVMNNSVSSLVSLQNKLLVFHHGARGQPFSA